jgi:UDP-N-acetylglucosamine 2-epimerase (non-hydrolysing)
MPRLAFVFGTRPEAIKMAPVVRAMRARPEYDVLVCSSGQHREMLDQVLEAFKITTDADLDLMRPSQPLASFTARAVEAIDEWLAGPGRADLVLVQGDTTTAFCGALAAFYRRIPVAHVEAGLRTGDLDRPWPEEANRVLTARLAALHFAPTERSRRNLRAEGVPDARIVVTGNTVIDALLHTVDRVRAVPPVIDGLPAAVMANGAPLVLVTAHRRESFGTGLDALCRAVAALAQRFPDTHFVYPVHLNPNVRASAARWLGGRRANVHLLEPLPYLAFVALMDRATLILTDSGGVQEEAPSLGKPVLVLRDTTERPEAVEAGTVRLVGTGEDAIVAETARLLVDEAAHAAMAHAHNPYGDGRAAERIEAAIDERFAIPRAAGRPAVPAFVGRGAAVARIMHG